MTPAAESSADGTGSARRSFPRTHRLKHRRLIRALFDRASPDVRKVSSGCVRAVFRFVSPGAAPEVRTSVQVGFFVGRKTGGAVGRNKIRRRMREAYRPHHAELLDIMAEKSVFLTLGLVYRGHTVESWDRITTDVADVLRTVRGITKSQVEATGPPGTASG